MARHVSVIIPAFNAARHLTEAVASVHRQRHEALDILVVDDGSTDGTAEVAAQLPGVSCLRQCNGGAAVARNSGILAANGEFLAFLDSDDLWTDGKLAVQLAVFNRDASVDLVAGRVEEFYDHDVPPSARRLLRQNGDRAYTIGALLIRRDTFMKVGLFSPELRFGEFMDWRSRALALGLREHVLDQVVLRRRIHSTNTTRLAQDYKHHYLATIRAHLQRQRTATEKPGGTP